MALTSYSGLSAAIGTWGTRTYSSDQTDEFILLAESKANRRLGADYRRDVSATVPFTSGSASLPTGFVRPISLVHATYGALKQRDIGVVRERRIWDASGIPDIFAVTASTLETGPSYTGDLTLDHEAKLTALSASNTSNWLLAQAPDAYLFLCRAAQAAFEEEFQQAAIFEAKGNEAIDDLVQQSMVARAGRSGVHIPGMTP